MYKGFIPYSYFIHLRFTFHCQALPSVYIYNLTSQSLSHKLLRASLSGGYYPSHTERSCPSRTLNKDRQSIDHTANTLRLQHNSEACKHQSTKYKTHWTLPLIPLVFLLSKSFIKFRKGDKTYKRPKDLYSFRFFTPSYKGT